MLTSSNPCFVQSSKYEVATTGGKSIPPAIPGKLLPTTHVWPHVHDTYYLRQRTYAYVARSHSPLLITSTTHNSDTITKIDHKATMVRLSALTVASLLPFTASAFSVSDASVSRREAFAKTATTLIGGTVAAGVVGVPLPAAAVVTDETPKVISRMGGLLVRC